MFADRQKREDSNLLPTDSNVYPEMQYTVYVTHSCNTNCTTKTTGENPEHKNITSKSKSLAKLVNS